MEAKNLSWFLLGCGLALLVVGLVMLRPLQLWAENALVTPAVTETATRVPRATWTPRPSATLPAGPLVWKREADGICQQLTVSVSGVVYYHRCDQGAIRGELTDVERDALDAYVARLAPMVVTFDDNTGAEVSLRFPGRGEDEATTRDRNDLADWALTVYERHEHEDIVANLVARCRVDLAGRLGISPDAITTESVVETTWPDACLGIELPGVACAEVETPGLRILLEAGETTYRYHTDLEDTILLVDDDSAPTAVPTAEPTDVPATSVPGVTVWPTSTPWPAATTRPTATPYATSVPMPVDAWRAEYFSNTNLIGQPVVVRNENDVRYDWGDTGPVAGFASDYWSARWSRRIYVSAGDYNWKLRGDDGVRLWVDGVLLINRWHGGYTDDVVKRNMGEGWHDVTVEYFELTGAASVRMTWEKFYDPKPPTKTLTPTRTSTPTRTATPTVTPTPVILGWRGEYHSGSSLTGDPDAVRDDAAINFDWTHSGLPAGISADTFGVRWSRTLWLNEGAYRFPLAADGEARVWVDGAPVIHAAENGAWEYHEGWLYLHSGQHSLVVEYRHTTGAAKIQFGWESVSTFKGWRAEYFANRHLSGAPTMIVDEPTLNHGWGRGAYALAGESDYFSARWTRTVQLAAGGYVFSALADDGVRVMVDGQLVIDEWHDSPGRWYHKNVALVTDGEHTVVVEYYEKQGNAAVALTWELAEVLVPTATPTNTPTNAPTSTLTPSAMPTATNTPTATATNTPEPTATPTNTPTASATPSSTATATATPSATATPTVTGTPPTATPTFPFRPTRKPRFSPSMPPYPFETPEPIWGEHTVTRTPKLKSWWLDLIQ